MVIEKVVLVLIIVCEVFDCFYVMMCLKDKVWFDLWIVMVVEIKFVVFVVGVEVDRDVVVVVILMLWFSGQVEGKVNCLKVIK